MVRALFARYEYIMFKSETVWGLNFHLTRGDERSLCDG
jgi:hypothetical protein